MDTTDYPVISLICSHVAQSCTSAVRAGEVNIFFFQSQIPCKLCDPILDNVGDRTDVAPLGALSSRPKRRRERERQRVEDEATIAVKIITVLTRYRPIVLELI